jgi:DNA-binding beta-propeller fold protein YncE
MARNSLLGRNGAVVLVCALSAQGCGAERASESADRFAVGAPDVSGAGVSGSSVPTSPGSTGGGGGHAVIPVAAPGAGAPSAGTGGVPAMAGDRAGTGPAAGGAGGDAGLEDGMRDVLLVGNSVAGTVSFIDVHTFENLGSVDVIPDLDEVMGLIGADLVRSIAYPIVQQAQLLHHFEPANGDRFVDDLFVSNDGTTLFVSRSNLGDVAAFDLTRPDHPRKWRTFVSSPKADHADISPDGTRLVVSATGTAQVADVIDTATGTIVGSFATGYFPHQNDYTDDGRYIYNSSIGDVRYQAVPYAQNAMKGDRWLVKVDAQTLQIVDTWVFDYGIRPNVFTPDERILYTQLSYQNAVIKYDLQAKREITRIEHPFSEFGMSTYATYDEFPHDSARHGLALSPDGTKLCDCGTVDNTVAIIDTSDMSLVKMIDVGMVPYWATNSPDGQYCFVSMSGDDTISVIDYEAAEQVTVVPVGDFPQRSRLGRIAESVAQMLNPSDR